MHERIVSKPAWFVGMFLGVTPGCLSVQDARPEPLPSTASENKAKNEQPLAGARACEPRACAPVTPGDALITDFGDVGADGVFVDGDNYGTRAPDWWQKFYGSPYVYPKGLDGLSQVIEGAWHVTGNVRDWSGFGLWFGACTVDLSAYRGVSFDVGGDVGTSGTLKLFINTAPNEPPETCRLNVGSCDKALGDCRHPMTRVNVAREVRNVSVLFSDAAEGAPEAEPDRAQILQLHFAFDWFDFQGQKQVPYPVDLTLDNFELIQ